MGGAITVLSPQLLVLLAGAAIFGAGAAGLPFIGLVIFCRHVPEPSFGRWFLIPALCSGWGAGIFVFASHFISSLVGWRLSLGIMVIVTALFAFCVLLVVKRIILSPPAYPIKPLAKDLKGKGLGVLIMLGLAIALTAGRENTVITYLPVYLDELSGRQLPSTENFGRAIAASNLVISLGIIIGAIIADFIKNPIYWIAGVVVSGALIAFIAMLSLFPESLKSGILLFSFGLTIGITCIPLLKLFVLRTPKKFLGIGLAYFQVCLGGLTFLLSPFESFLIDEASRFLVGWLITSLLIAASLLVIVQFITIRREGN